MATKASNPEQPPELLPVEVLRKKYKTAMPIFSGVCEANGWRPGKAITDEIFREAVDKFTKSPMAQPTKREAKKQC